MTKTSWIFLLRLAVNDKMVRESMSNLLVLLVCCLLSLFCISHHNVENGELPIFEIPLLYIFSRPEWIYLSLHFGWGMNHLRALKPI